VNAVRVGSGIAAALLVLAAIAAIRSGAPPANAREPARPSIAVQISIPARTPADEPAPVRLTRASARMNLLLVSIDTLRADRLGLHGYPRATSPAIDALAREAIVFDQATTPMPKTTPALASLLSGLSPNRHGVRRTAAPVPASVPLVTEQLRDAGYATAGVCGQHNCDAIYGFARGFESYDDAFAAAAPADSGPADRAGGRFHPESEKRAGAVVDSALAWLRGRDRERPFFLWLHFMDPHAGYAPPEPFLSLYSDAPPYRDRSFLGAKLDPRLMQRQARVAGVDEYDFYLNRYDGEIRYLDSELARLLAYLDREGLFATTALVLTADHGEYLGESDARHVVFQHGDTATEGEVRIPLVLKLPGGASARDDRLASLTDVAPTLLELAGAAASPPLEGRSLLAPRSAARRVQVIELPEPGVAGGPRHPFEGTFAVRTAASKVVIRVRPRRGCSEATSAGSCLAASAQVYDLARDPLERTSIAAQRRSEAQHAADALAAWLAERAGPPLAGDALAPSEEALRHLRALGYVE
jgi:arylsulfatase